MQGVVGVDHVLPDLFGGQLCGEGSIGFGGARLGYFAGMDVA